MTATICVNIPDEINQQVIEAARDAGTSVSDYVVGLILKDMRPTPPTVQLGSVGDIEIKGGPNAQIKTGLEGPRNEAGDTGRPVRRNSRDRSED